MGPLTSPRRILGDQAPSPEITQRSFCLKLDAMTNEARFLAAIRDCYTPALWACFDQAIAIERARCAAISEAVALVCEQGKTEDNKFGNRDGAAIWAYSQAIAKQIAAQIRVDSDANTGKVSRL